MSVFETVLISALTSAGVALAVEWAAKPRLEARKERILEQAKTKRVIENDLNRIVSLATSLDAGISGEDTFNLILLLSANLEISLAEVALKTEPRTRRFIAQVATWIQGVARSDRSRGQVIVKDLVYVSSLARDLYCLRWWRFRKRRQLLKAAHLLTDSTPPPSS